jgi:hypothetical protein
MFKKPSPAFLGFLQATGVAVYLVLIAVFFANAQYWVDTTKAEFYAPIMMLLLFMISAVITATLVLGKAGVLFWNKQYKEAFTLLGWTLGWMFLYFMTFLLMNLKR